MLGRCLLSKISASKLRRKFIKSPLLVGEPSPIKKKTWLGNPHNFKWVEKLTLFPGVYNNGLLRRGGEGMGLGPKMPNSLFFYLEEKKGGEGEG